MHNICSFVFVLFLSLLCVSLPLLSLSLSLPPNWAHSMMTKYPTCRKRFGRQFKQRYFRLTTHSLSYAKSKGKQPICDIPLEEIGSVEQLKDKSFKMQNCFKVSYNQRSQSIDKSGTGLVWLFSKWNSIPSIYNLNRTDTPPSFQ